MARAVRKSRLKEVPLSEIKDDLSRFLREAEKQEIVITGTESLPVFSSVSRLRTTGSTISWRMTHGFLSASSRRGRVYELAAEPDWKTYLSSGAV